MKTFLKSGGYTLHVDGHHVPAISTYNIEIYSKYEECRFPDEKRSLIKLNLTKQELEDLIGGLVSISLDLPK